MKTVWKFTNKRELTAREFADYFEKKVRGTIRKYQMPIHAVDGDSLNAKVINNIIKNLPKRKGKISEENLDDISVAVLSELMHGKAENLKKFLPKNQPLYFLSDKEIELYAKIKKIKGIKEARKKMKKRAEKKDRREEKINNFIKKIEEKNPDIRHNIIKALDVFN
ncbi:hypothetical protein A3K73_06720 [Candidatus Pacearchaeota archaeon RBG_13_36_9]|nr:MAG: hypothetical protein A3K73_06720 [Candidatus Pacearchaeota archaeon RBG_13_36_9]